MKILVLGDVVGRPGRIFLTQRLQGVRSELSVDLVIANGENAAGGAGITAKTAEELKRAGVDAITLGDHVWDQKNFENEIKDNIKKYDSGFWKKIVYINNLRDLFKHFDANQLNSGWFALVDKLNTSTITYSWSTV